MNAKGPSPKNDEHSISPGLAMLFLGLVCFLLPPGAMHWLWRQPTQIPVCPSWFNNILLQAKHPAPGDHPPDYWIIWLFSVSSVTPKSSQRCLLSDLFHCAIFISAGFCELSFVFRKQMVFMLISPLRLFSNV